MVTRKKIEDIIHFEGEVLTTIAMPTHKKGEDAKQDPIRFKNLLNNASDKLKEKGFKENEIDDYLKEAADLLNVPSFWIHVEKGLVIYISEDRTEVFQLPYQVKESVYVNDHTLVTPLLPMISLDGIYAVLAVGRQNIRLIECTRFECEDITPDDLPRSIKEYYDDMPDAPVQFHTGASKNKAMYFGHGAGKEDEKEVVSQFFGKIENIVTPLMKKKQIPLVLIGLQENIAMYKKSNNYNRTLEESVDMNPAEKSEKELQRAGWEVVKKHFLKDLYEAKEIFRDASNKLTSNNLTEIIKSTIMGKTRTLLIAADEERWGKYNSELNEVEYSNNSNSNNIDLINWSAMKALENGSVVYALPREEMPYKVSTAAIFRY